MVLSSQQWITNAQYVSCMNPLFFFIHDDLFLYVMYHGYLCLDTTCLVYPFITLFGSIRYNCAYLLFCEI